MNDDRAFLASLVGNPKDDAPWLVYADWLDERGDPRGEYLRLVHDLAIRPDPDRRRRLNAVRPTLPREWLVVVEQPAILRANSTAYWPLWFGFGLGDLRRFDSINVGFQYSSLPCVPSDWVAGFEYWLARMADGIVPVDVNADDPRALAWALYDQQWQVAIPCLSIEVRDFGLTLPDHFIAFISDNRHFRLSQSPMGGSYYPPGRIEPAPQCPEAGLVRFFSDSSMYSYLFLTPEGDECVVVSSACLGGVRDEHGEYSDVEDLDTASKASFWFCAPSFAEFVVRTWIEQMAWYSIHPGGAREQEISGSRMPEVQ